MVWMLLASNILAGAAIALTFRPLMIVVLAPVVLFVSAALLYLLQIDVWSSVLTLAACLILNQLSFAITSALVRRGPHRNGVTGVRTLLERLRKCLP